MKTKPLVGLLFIVTTLTGCASVKTLQATGGSRADGIVELSYEYDIFEEPQVQWDQGLVTATERCKAWGYQGAEAFGATTSECQAYNSYGACVQWLVRVKYQCIGSPQAWPSPSDPEVPELVDKAPRKKRRATATGFAISKDGLIVTAHHVVEDAKTITVHLSEDSAASARVVLRDPMNDLAVLGIDNATPSFLQLAPMRSAKTGDRVFTLGFPVSSILGREPKYTEGVISSVSGIGDSASFLQITVPVQPGNSGGPLVNEDGKVVGIITATAAILPFIKETGTLPQNVNWAVKADYLRPMIDLPKTEQRHMDKEELIAHVEKSTFLIETAYGQNNETLPSQKESVEEADPKESSELDSGGIIESAEAAAVERSKEVAPNGTIESIEGAEAEKSMSDLDRARARALQKKSVGESEAKKSNEVDPND